MKFYGEQDIQEVPLRSPYFCKQVERFLGANGLRMESLDAYYVFRNADGDIIAGAGVAGHVIKDVAVAEEARSEGLMVPLISRIISERQGKPLKVFTKPENQAIFESLGFRLLAAAPLAILMENGRGLEQYVSYLRSFAARGRCGVVVMNANPFTLGHRYLLEQAAARVDRLFVIPVSEDLSDFPYAERLAMIRAACANLASAGPTPAENYFSGQCPKNQFSADIATPPHADAKVVVLEGCDYVISALTFPTYFLKDLSMAAETQMRLDLDLFGRWIAPALGASVRFVGSEPLDPLTNRYNEMMQEVLPLEVVVLPRLKTASSVVSGPDRASACPADTATPTHADAVAPDQASPISASAVRRALAGGRFSAAAALCPPSTWPYLLAALAERALRRELDTPCKPGLVGPDGSGAHRDMDYGTMLAGIGALRPFWSRMAMAGSVEELRQLGIEAEAAMMAATGGVNTHRGAIFSQGIALHARGDRSRMAALAAQICGGNHSRGARQIALDGYKPLFEDWLPYYASGAGEQKTLLRIMSTLDDTCVVKRVGEEKAREVKREAGELLENYSEEKLKDMCRRYAREGISPGGAADMLALTIFMYSILN